MNNKEGKNFILNLQQLKNIKNESKNYDDGCATKKQSAEKHSAEKQTAKNKHTWLVLKLIFGHLTLINIAPHVWKLPLKPGLVSCNGYSVNSQKVKYASFAMIFPGKDPSNLLKVS